jgi:hypothetical protein
VPSQKRFQDPKQLRRIYQAYIEDAIPARVVAKRFRCDASTIRTYARQYEQERGQRAMQGSR